MQYWSRNLYILWFGCFCASMSYTIVVPFMPLFLEQLNVTTGVEAWSGVVLSAGFLMSAIVSPIWGSMADRYGRKAMILRAGFGMSTCYALQYFVSSPYQLLALRALNGLFSGFIPASTALIATNTPEDKIGSCLGIVQTASASGQIMGPLIGGVISELLGMRMTFLVAGAALFSSTLVVGFFVHETKRVQPGTQIHVADDVRGAMRNAALRTVLISSAMVQIGLTTLQPVLSLQVEALGQEGTAALAAGAIYSVTGVATVIGAPAWARRGQSLGYKQVLVANLLAAGLFNIPLAFVKSIFLFGALRFAVGLATAGIGISVNALTAKSVDVEFRGRAFGILQSFNQLGGMFGPLLGGVAGTVTGLASTFALAAFVLIGTSVIVARFLRSPQPEAARAQA